jgi:pimeloyl-ACP methyl ester carboxylesterase
MSASEAVIRRGYLDGPSGQIHYRHCTERAVNGDSGEPLILLHQSPLSSTQFEAVMPALAAAGFDVLALDMPGFGMSDVAAEGATLEDFAEIIPAGLRAMGWSSAHLVGHHTGAVLGAVFAASHPTAVKKLVLNGFPLLGKTERDHFATFYFGPKDPKPDGSHLLIAWENRLRSTPGWTDLRLMHRYTVEALHRDGSNWRAFPLVVSADLESVLRRLSVPTLMFTNTGEDLYQSSRRAHALRSDFFAYAELEGGSHDIVDEQPANWVREVVRFLRS